jgi:hypothetical protein
MPQTSVKTRKPSHNLDGWCYHTHPTASAWHLFRPLKDAVHGRKFEADDDDDVISTIKTWLCQQDKEWYWSSTHALMPQWHTTIELHTEYVEN